MAQPDIKKLMKRRENSSVFDMAKEGKKPFEANTTDLFRRRNNAKSDLEMWRHLLKRAYKYAQPNYNPWENHGRGGALTPGQNLNYDIYDLTLPIAHQRLVNKMITGMVPQGQQWVKFLPGKGYGREGSPQYVQALKATQEITDQWFDLLDRSNFHTAFAESLSDAVISTGVLTVNAGTKKKPFRFESVPVSQVMFEGDPLGGFSAVFRDWLEVRVEQIRVVWPDANLPANKEGHQTVNIYECSYIDYDADPSERYRYTVMTSNKEILLQESSASWPWIIYRMRKLTGENRGRGPSLDAMPTAATINEAVGDELMAAAFTANPMYMASSDSAFNSDSFVAKPGVVIPVQMVMGQFPIQSFPGGGNIDFSTLLVSDFRQQINELLFTAPLGPVGSPDSTATEANMRWTENLESFMAMIPRLQNEFFDPLIARTFFIANQLVPEMFGNIDEELRRELISPDGEILDIRYETPLMTARGQMKTNALLNYHQSVAALLGPDIATASLNAPAVTEAVAVNSGTEVKLVKPEEQIQQELDTAAQIATEQFTNEQDIDPTQG